jgi:hypothetical protein
MYSDIKNKDTDGIKSTEITAFKRVIDQLKFEIKEYSDYLDIIKGDEKCEKDVLVENDAIKASYRVDMSTLTEDKKQEMRAKFREDNSIRDKSVKESKDYETTLNIADRLIKAFEFTEFKDLLQILRDGCELFLIDTLTLNLPDKLKQELINMYDSNEKIQNLNKEVNNTGGTDTTDNSKLITALKELNSQDWFLISLTPAIGKLSPIHRIIHDAMSQKDSKNMISFILMKTSRIEALLEYVPVDVWLCPWYCVRHIMDLFKKYSFTPIQYLTSWFKMVFVQNIYLKKQLFEIISKYKKYIGDKYNLRFIRIKETDKIVLMYAPLNMYFKETVLDKGIFDMDNFDWTRRRD